MLHYAKSTYATMKGSRLPYNIACFAKFKLYASSVNIYHS